MVRPDYSLHYPNPETLNSQGSTSISNSNGNNNSTNDNNSKSNSKGVDGEEDDEIPLTVFRGFSRKRKSARVTRPWPWVPLLTKRVNQEGVCLEQQPGPAWRWLLAASSTERPHHLRVTFTPDDENVLLATGGKEGSEEEEDEEEEENNTSSGDGEKTKPGKNEGEGKGDEKTADIDINTSLTSPPSTSPPRPLRPRRLRSTRPLFVSRAPSHIQWATPPPLPVNTPLSTLPAPQGGQLNARLLPTSPLLALEGVGVGVSTLVGPEGKLISSSRGLQDKLIFYSLGR